MRWSHFIFIQFAFIIIVVGLLYSHKDRVVIAKSPPESLSQWYKPENKRQVWLHNMFKLRREMQAVKLYSDNGNQANLEKWTKRFAEHYIKIGEMVPEWKKKLNLDAISDLQQQVKNKNSQALSLSLKTLNKNCDSCHNDFRVITAAKYRAPDFSEIKLDSDNTFKEHMDTLTQLVNKIKIAAEDGMQDVALTSLATLEKDMTTLGKACVSCHKKDTRLYPDVDMKVTLRKLTHSLKNGTLKEQGKHLGTLAVQACARCHGTHRISYDLRQTITDSPVWIKLITH